MDPSSVLQELTTRASRYSVNVNGEVSLKQDQGPWRGSTAIVRKGTLIRSGTEVAVKTFHGAPPGDRASLERILREVHLWSKLRHDNVVPMIGISTEFGFTISIVSEWMALGNARSYVQNKENDPRPLLADIASGLDYLHNYSGGKIVHGDLKGVNVLVSSDRRAVLSDFGLSTLQESTFSMTVTAPRGCTYAWVAPELLDDFTPSAEGDVWAYGMVVLELFTRLTPFHDCRSPVNVMSRLMTRRLPPRPSDESTLSRMTDEWWEICTSCWRHEPSSRPSMKELMEKAKGFKYQAVPALMLPQGSIPMMPYSNDVVHDLSSDQLLQPHVDPLRDNLSLRTPSMMFHNLTSCDMALRGHDTDEVSPVASSRDAPEDIMSGSDNSTRPRNMQLRIRVGFPLTSHVGVAVIFLTSGELVLIICGCLVLFLFAET